MVIDIKNVYDGITARIDFQEVANKISSSLSTIIKTLNNPFLSDIWKQEDTKTFSTYTDGEEKYLQVNLNLENIIIGMAISIHKTKYLDGIYIVKDIINGFVVFENKSILGNSVVEEDIKWYVLKLPQGIEKIISDIIEIQDFDMRDLAGLNSISQGTDEKGVKSGSTLRHYITTALTGYFRQPPDYVLKGFLI